MATQERSAGVIVYHAPTSESERRYLLLDYGKHWDFPKGHVEKRESDEQAALRELHEETGISNPQFVADFIRQIVYFFRHPKRGLIRKEVVFYLARVMDQRITLSHEHVGYAFLPFDRALAQLTYANAKQVLKDAHEHLSKLG